MMYKNSINQVLNIVVLIMPIVFVCIVVYIKRNQKISVDQKQCAAVWERIVAIIFDMILCLLVFYGLTTVIERFNFNKIEIYINVFYFVLIWLYFAICESSKAQATFGKRAQGIIVTDIEGNRIKFLKSSVRFFSTIISDMSLFIGHIIIPFTNYKQGFHDMITNTLVIRKK